MFLFLCVCVCECGATHIDRKSIKLCKLVELSDAMNYWKFHFYHTNGLVKLGVRIQPLR
jgi:hypothetical protein